MLESTYTPLLGYPVNSTPNLLKRKSELVIFSGTRAVAQDSRAGAVALMTGKSPVTTGVFSY